MGKGKSYPPQCEGWRRYGGAFTLGPTTWEQCKELGIVDLTFIQDGKRLKMPACKRCWVEASESTAIKILKATPIK